MSYFDKLKIAIKNRDWKSVEDVYEKITGDKITKKQTQDIQEVQTSKSDFTSPKRVYDDKFETVRISKVNLFKDDLKYNDNNIAPDKKAPARKAKKTRAKTLVECEICGEKEYSESIKQTGIDEDGNPTISYAHDECLIKKRVKRK